MNFLFNFIVYNFNSGDKHLFFLLFSILTFSNLFLGKKWHLENNLEDEKLSIKLYHLKKYLIIKSANENNDDYSQVKHMQKLGKSNCNILIYAFFSSFLTQYAVT